MGKEGAAAMPKPAKRRRWDAEKPEDGTPAEASRDCGPAARGPPPLPLGGLAASLQKAKEALKMQKQIAEKLKGLKQKGISVPVDAASVPTGGPKPLRLDSQGREVDDDGNPIERNDVSREASAKKAKIGENKAVARPTEEPEDDTFLDPRMRAGPGLRRKRATLEFVQEGRFQRQAQRNRMKAKFAEMGQKGQKGQRAERSLSPIGRDDEVDANAVPLGKRSGAEEAAAVEVEWWDAIILRDGKYPSPSDEAGPSFTTSKITSYVEHPVPIQPPNERAEPAPQPLKLTKREQKKLRTQQRQAREKEKQEMIKQGLLEPPKPKVKISNLMRVLGADTTQDAMKIEKEVRAQMDERQQAHEDRNLARKLTPAERRDKKLRKMFDPENGLFMAVFKVGSLRNPQHKYKVNVNAEQNMLTGCVVTGDSHSLVVVEGCSKSVVRYKKLMLKRIQWDSWIAGEDAPEDLEGNSCALLWEGSIKEVHFKNFRREQVKTDVAARKYLLDFGLEHLWDLGSGTSATADQ